MKIMKYFSILLFFIALIYMNAEAIPRPSELTSYDFLTSGGIDIDVESGNSGERCSITYMNDKKEEGYNKKDDKSPEQQSDNEVVNMKAMTISEISEKIYNETKKSLGAAHISKILIGEDTLKTSFAYLIDESARNKRLRLDTNVFVTKNSTAEEFFNEVDTGYEEFSKDLEFVTKQGKSMANVTDMSLKDLTAVFYSDTQTGLIPALEVVPFDTEGEKGESEEKKTFRFCGMGIIKDGSLTDYIDFEHMRAYAMLKDSLKSSSVNITDENGNITAFNIISSKNKTDFVFNKEDKNKLEKIKVEISLNVVYAETDSTTNEFIYDNFLKLEELQNEKIKAEAIEIIRKSQETNCDFLGYGEKLSLTHPYKWHSLKDNWQETYKNIQFEIIVNTKITRTFDLRKNVR